MTQTTQTGFTTTLAKKLLPGDTTMELATAPTITKGRCKVNVGDNSEWIKFTGLTGSTLTGLVRGLSKTAVPATSGTGLTHPAGTVVKIVIMHDQLLDKQEDESLSGIITVPSIRFSDTTTSGLRLKSLTTTQRDALTPATGDQIFNSTSGTVQTYYGGTWNDNASGTTANASETVAGKGQVGTDTQFTNGTLVGSTGATLWATLVQLAKSILLKPTTSTTSDTYYFGVNNGTVDQKITQLLLRDQIVASTSQRGFTKLVSNEVSAMTNTELVVTPYSLFDIFTYGPGSIIGSSADTERTFTSSTPALTKKFDISKSGTFTFSFERKVNAALGPTATVTIYKNGSTLGLTSSGQDFTYTSYSSDIAVTAGDTIELWCSQTGGGIGYVRNFRLGYALTLNTNVQVTDRFGSTTLN